MAFEDIKQATTARKANDMEVGEAIDAFVLGITTRVNEEDGRNMYNLKLRDAETGEEFVLFTSGTLMYDVQDGRVKVGLRTIITKTEERNKTNKRGQFKVQQDPEQTVEVSAADSIPDLGGGPTPPQAVRSANGAQQAIERNAVAQRAQDLMKAAKAGKRA